MLHLWVHPNLSYVDMVVTKTYETLTLLQPFSFLNKTCNLSIYLFINFISPLGILVIGKCKQPEISIHEKFCPSRKKIIIIIIIEEPLSKQVQHACEEASFR